jgi:predicted nucleotidyltransferase
VQSQIADRLDRLEATQDVTVLYACESGSRAWGFASADSDYDVRVVYVHPRDWYLSVDLERRDDTIDPPVENEIDLHGWDLRKALGLFRGANPTLREWLRSPVVYREDTAVMDRWRALVPDYYPPGAVARAYRGLARSVAEQNLTGAPISHKAYLYVLRALLAVRWVEQDRGPVPLSFERLLDETVGDAAVRDAVETLLTQKRDGGELDDGPRRPVIHDFVETELERQRALDVPSPASRAGGDEPLNALFRAVLDRHADSSVS